MVEQAATVFGKDSGKESACNIKVLRAKIVLLTLENIFSEGAKWSLC